MNFRDFEVYEIGIYEGENQISKITLVRHLSPILIERIFRNLPIKAFTLILRNKLLLNINIPASAVRKVYSHSPGDISYDPVQKAITIYFDNETDYLEKIGYVSEGLENLKKLKSGIFLSLNKFKPV
jgi:hypothetical protein